MIIQELKVVLLLLFCLLFLLSVMALCVSYSPRLHPRRYHKSITVKPALPFDTGCSRALAVVVWDAHLSTLRCPARVPLIAFWEVFIVTPRYSNRYFEGGGRRRTSRHFSPDVAQWYGSENEIWECNSKCPLRSLCWIVYWCDVGLYSVGFKMSCCKAVQFEPLRIFYVRNSRARQIWRLHKRHLECWSTVNWRQFF